MSGMARPLLAAGFALAGLANAQEYDIPVPLPEPVINVTWDPAQQRHLPLCHHSIVSRSCGQLNGEDGAESVTLARLESQVLRTNDGSTTDALWTALKLDRTQEIVGCMDLCEAIVSYVTEIGAVLPPASDFACYTLWGRTVCDVDVSPTRLADILRPIISEDMPPEDVVNVDTLPDEDGIYARTTVAGPGIARPAKAGSASAPLTKAAGGSLRGRAGASWLSPTTTYSLWQMVDRLANVFRIFPTRGDDLSVVLPGSAAEQTGEATAPAEIAKSTAEAKAWLSEVLNQMQSGGTQASMTEWFGGQGSLPAQNVRDRVWRTMVFIERELMDGIRFVYPADDASSTNCQGGVVAYVWKWSVADKGYSETQGPVCNPGEDPAVKRCGVDNQGRYFVYLCRRWYDVLGDSLKISTFVHEAAHHAGPRDVTYDRDTMKRNGQDLQLSNAANYQYFAQSVVERAWGCADAEVVTGLPYTCSSGPCPCNAFGSMCDGSQYSAQIRAQCPSTCGRCNSQVVGVRTSTPAPTSSPAQAPTPPPTPAPTPRPTPAPTPAPTQAPTSPPASPPRGCSDRAGTFTVTSGVNRFTASCASFGYYNYCSEAEVRQNCPVTCKICQVTGCQDDPNFSVRTSIGPLGCEDWKRYVCWESVKQSCPVACKVDGCGR